MQRERAISPFSISEILQFHYICNFSMHFQLLRVRIYHNDQRRIQKWHRIDSQGLSRLIRMAQSIMRIGDVHAVEELEELMHGNTQDILAGNVEEQA